MAIALKHALICMSRLLSDGKRALLCVFTWWFLKRGVKDGAAFAAEAFTQHGCAFAAVGYRLTPTVCLTDIVTQIDAAIHFLYQNADKWGFDPGGLVIGGHSAGAHWQPV